MYDNNTRLYIHIKKEIVEYFRDELRIIIKRAYAGVCKDGTYNLYIYVEGYVSASDLAELRDRYNLRLIVCPHGRKHLELFTSNQTSSKLATISTTPIK